MNYELLENITSADIAIRVTAPSENKLFIYGAESLMSEMIEDISSIEKTITKHGELTGEDLSLLYFDFLNEFLFFKDSENLLLLPVEVAIFTTDGIFSLRYSLAGEKINREIHKFKVDIKAVTLHCLKLYKKEDLFIAESVFDA